MTSLIKSSKMHLLLMATSIIYMAHILDAGPVGTDDSCPPDMTSTCKRICFGHCGDLNRTSEGCIEPCIVGCDCNDPKYVRSSDNSKVCVLPSTCTVPCPKNMHFNPCLRKSEPTCDESAKARELPCLPRCVCNEGYVSNGNLGNRQCIKRSECPS